MIAVWLDLERSWKMSLVNIEVFNKESELAVAVKFEAVEFTKMAKIMVEGYQKLWGYLAKCGKQMTGVPYCKYTNGSADFMKWDIELGVPVSEPLPEQGEFYMGKTCEGKAISAIHKGAYKDIEKTYTPMMQYLAENKLESTGVYYDYYLSNPADTPESELLTKVVFPIK
jgi:effector-binding domain-containing protein